MDPRPPDGRSWSGQAYVSLLGSAARALRLLRQLDVDACLIGGLAMSARCDPRFTRDIDLAVAIADDAVRSRSYRRLPLPAIPSWP